MDLGSQVVLIETVLCSGVVVDACLRRYAASRGVSAGMIARLAAALGTALFLLLVGSVAHSELGYAILWGLVAQGICAALAERLLMWRTESGSLMSLFRWTAAPGWFVGLVFLGMAALGGLEARNMAVPLTVERWMIVAGLLGVAAAIGVMRDLVSGLGGLRQRLSRTIDLTNPGRDLKLTKWLGCALALWTMAACLAWATGGRSATLEALKAASIACTAVGLLSTLPRPACIPQPNANKRVYRWERVEWMGQAATLLCAAALLAPGI